MDNISQLTNKTVQYVGKDRYFRNSRYDKRQFREKTLRSLCIIYLVIYGGRRRHRACPKCKCFYCLCVRDRPSDQNASEGLRCEQDREYPRSRRSRCAPGCAQRRLRRSRQSPRSRREEHTPLPGNRFPPELERRRRRGLTHCRTVSTIFTCFKKNIAIDRSG